MARIDIEISENVSAAFERAAAALSDLTIPMQQIASFGVDETKKNFAGEHDPLGVPWKALAVPRTNGKNILHLSGDLEGSIIGRGAALFAEWGSEGSAGARDYAAIHQFGGIVRAKSGKALRTPFGPRTSVTIPARPFVGWNADMEAFTLGALGDHIEAAFAGAAA